MQRYKVTLLGDSQPKAQLLIRAINFEWATKMGEGLCQTIKATGVNLSYSIKQLSFENTFTKAHNEATKKEKLNEHIKNSTAGKG